MHDPLRATILARAADLVRKGWTTGAMARDADGLPVDATSPRATRWCLVGAILRACYDVPSAMTIFLGGDGKPRQAIRHEVLADIYTFVRERLVPGGEWNEGLFEWNDAASADKVETVLQRLAWGLTNAI